MKINLLTFHCALNFGAVLQTYALGRVLRSMGHSVTLLDLRPPALTEGPTFHPVGLLRRAQFARFVRRYCPPRKATTDRPGDIWHLAPTADAWVVGSDQVWNPEITGSYVADYFLQGVPSDARRVAYAASYGRDTLRWEDKLRNDVTRWLSAFDAISVREESGLRLLSDLGAREAVQALDPALLLGDFRELIGPPRAQKAELLCMVFEPRDRFVPAVTAMADALSLVPVMLTRRAPDGRFKAVRYPHVREWVRRFHEAAFVVTDSFHGLALSLIFNKPFVVLPANPDRFCRLRELLNSLGLAHRAFETYGELLTDHRWRAPVPYEEVNHLLAGHRAQSLAFLRSHLPVSQ